MNYLLTGPEDYLKHQFLEKLKKSILKISKDSQSDFEVFYGGVSEISGILNSFNTLPFFSKNKLAVIKDIDKFSPKEKDSVLKYLKSPRSSTTLVLETSSSKFDKFLEEASKSTKLIRCNRLSERDLAVWIKNEFTAHKKKISLPLANLIKELTGKDLFLLKNEIEKIISFTGDADEITEDHIEAVSGKTAYKTAFEIVDLVLEKRLDRVLASMGGLLLKEKPNGILNLLAWQFRNFMRVKDLSDKASAGHVARALSMNSAFAKKILKQSQCFTRSDLKKNLETILEADFSIKRGKINARHALECALAGLSSSV